MRLRSVIGTFAEVTKRARLALEAIAETVEFALWAWKEAKKWHPPGDDDDS